MSQEQQPPKRPKLSAKDINLIKAGLRRAFARSDYYQSIASANYVEHSDPKSPRCLKWSWCSKCGEVVKRYTTDLDHISPVVPLDRHTEDMDPHELLDRIWCAPDNLEILCKRCHDEKSARERKLRPKKKRKALK